MPTAQGSSVSIRVGAEATYSTDAIAMAEMPVIPSIVLKETQTQNQSAVLNGRRDESEPFNGYVSAEASFSVPLDTDLVGFWFKHFLGTVNTTGADPYTHIFTRHDTTLQSMTIEKAHIDIAKFHKGNGFKGNSFTVSFGGEDEVKLDLDFLGQKVTNSGTQLVVPTTGGEGGFYQPFECSLVGATSVKNANLTFTNNLDGNQYIIGDNGVRGEIPLGMIGISGSITALYEDDTLLDLAKAGTTTALSFSFTQGADSCKFDLEEVKLEPTGIDVPNPEGLEATFNFRAFYKAGTNGSGLTVELINSVVSY